MTEPAFGIHRRHPAAFKRRRELADKFAKPSYLFVRDVRALQRDCEIDIAVRAVHPYQSDSHKDGPRKGESESDNIGSAQRDHVDGFRREEKLVVQPTGG